MKCPKCGYSRTFGETAPDWQCPSCGVAYAKAEAGKGGEARERRPSRSAGFPIGRIIVVAVMVAIGWAMVPGSRHGSGLVPRENVANASIVMYSLTTCGYCNAKRAELKARGIPFVEYFIDTDRAHREELFEKLIAAGYKGGGIGTPTFEVNGKMLPNNPSLDTLIRNL